MTTFNIDHKDGKVRLGISGEQVTVIANAEQLIVELTPKEASDLSGLLLRNSLDALIEIRTTMGQPK